MPTLSEPRPPFSLNKVSGALDLEVPSALQMHRCPWPSPRGRPALGPKPMNGVFVVPPLWPLEAAWYGLPPSRGPSVGGSDSGAGLRQLCLPGPRATPPAPAGQSQGGQHQPSPITLSAGMPLPIWAQGPHVTSWQKEPWTGQDREARCQLLAGTRSSQGPRPWLLSDFSFFKIYY